MFIYQILQYTILYNKMTETQNIDFKLQYEKLLLDTVRLNETNIDLFNILNHTLEHHESFVKKQRDEYNRNLKKYIENNNLSIKQLDEEKYKSLQDLLNKEIVINEEDKKQKLLEKEYKGRLKNLHIKFHQLFFENEKLKLLMSTNGHINLNDNNNDNDKDKDKDKVEIKNTNDKKYADPHSRLTSLLSVGFMYGIIGFTAVNIVTPIVIVYGITSSIHKFMNK